MLSNIGWIGLACLSALFAGLTSILAKVGLNHIDSSLATALRTIFVLFFSYVVVLFTGHFEQIYTLHLQTWFFLICSGLTTGLSWLCYFKALQIGDVNKVAAIDKCSTVLTMILALIFFHEKLTWLKILSMILILIGTMLMLEKQKHITRDEKKSWLVYACGSAFFASLTAIVSKIGMININSHLGTMIRTFVVLIMAWLMVFIQGNQKDLYNIKRKNILFIVLSAIATGLSWLCYFKALQLGDVSIVVPIDKLSIVVTFLFSVLFLKEQVTKKSLLGLIFIIGGTLLLV